MPDEPSSGNVFTRKVGPLPMWGWMGIALALALVYYFIKKKKSSSSDLSGQIPEFVNQTYVENIPTEPPPYHPPPKHHKPPTKHPKPHKGHGHHPPPKHHKPPTHGKEHSQYQTYTVKRGDTLSKIAEEFEVEGGFAALAKLNGITDPNLIYPGQKLKIPIDNDKGGGED